MSITNDIIESDLNKHCLSCMSQLLQTEFIVNQPEIVIEHKHRYNFSVAPDPISNRSITPSDSILPPRIFFSRIAVNSIIEGHPKAGDILSEII